MSRSQAALPRILFVPIYCYSSNPLFKAIKERMPPHYSMYLLPTMGSAQEMNRDYIAKNDPRLEYDECVLIDVKSQYFREPEEKTLYRKLVRLFNKVTKYRRYQYSIIKTIRNFKPDLIILPSDMAYTSQIIHLFIKKTPVVIFQPTFLNLEKKEEPKLDFKAKIQVLLGKIKFFIRRFVNIMIEIVVGSSFKLKQKYFGLENHDATLCLWQPSVLDFYKERRDKVELVPNPFHCTLIDQQQHIDPKAKTDLLTQLFGNRASLKTIVVYVEDLSKLFGEEVQAFIEQQYRQLVEKQKEHYNFIFKVHPHCSIDKWENLLTAGKGEYLQIIPANTYNDLVRSVADINISVSSYAGVEAMICGSVTIGFVPSRIAGYQNASLLNEYTEHIYSDAEQISSLLIKLSDNAYFTGEKARIREKVKVLFSIDKCNTAYWHSFFYRLLGQTK